MTRTVHAGDLFAGAGGTSTGLARACRKLGLEIDLLAVNHWETAVASHQANHPWARHVCARVETLDPRTEVPGGRLDILAASPECRHHSRAAGNRRLNDQKRASAWHLLPWLEQLDVRALLIENVPELVNWGRLGKDGRPVKSEAGELFKPFVRSIVAHGYNVEWRILNAADYGDATSRSRFFLMARKGNNPVYWPTPTHSRGGRVPGTKRWRPAAEVIDLSRPSRSVFGRPLARNTWRRILEGVGRFGTPEMEPFLMVLRDQVGGPALSKPSAMRKKAEPFVFDMVGRRAAPGVKPKSLQEPMDTIVATRCSRYVAEPFILPPEGPYRGNAPRSIEDPLHTITAERGGDAYLVRAGFHPPHDRMGAAPRSVEEPMPTLTSAHGIELCQPYLVPHMSEREGQRARVHSISDPMPTLHCRPPDLASAYLVQYNGQSGTRSLDQPLPTVTTHDRLALVQPVISGTALDIRMRMLDTDELSGATGFPWDYKFEGSRSAVVRQIGNAVPVSIAEALCTALLTDAPTPILDALAAESLEAGA